jgi:hypothetical protein
LGAILIAARVHSASEVRFALSKTRSLVRMQFIEPFEKTI